MLNQPGNRDFEIMQGSFWSEAIQWLGDQAQPRMDLTGYKARLQARRGPGYSEALIDLTTENGGIGISGTDAVIVLMVKPEDTQSITAPILHYNLELIPPDSTLAFSLLRGRIKLIREVTT